MKKYRLKKEARQFFDSDEGRHIETLRFWEARTIPIQLLDEVPKYYVIYGHPSSDGKSSSLKGWDGRTNETKINFTITTTELDNIGYEKIDIAKMMDEIQKVINQYF